MPFTTYEITPEQHAGGLWRKIKLLKDEIKDREEIIKAKDAEIEDLNRIIKNLKISNTLLKKNQ